MSFVLGVESSHNIVTPLSKNFRKDCRKTIPRHKTAENSYECFSGKLRDALEVQPSYSSEKYAQIMKNSNLVSDPLKTCCDFGDLRRIKPAFKSVFLSV